MWRLIEMGFESIANKMLGYVKDLHDKANDVSKHEPNLAIDIHRLANKLEDLVFDMNSEDVKNTVNYTISDNLVGLLSRQQVPKEVVNLVTEYQEYGYSLKQLLEEVSLVGTAPESVKLWVNENQDDLLRIWLYAKDKPEVLEKYESTIFLEFEGEQSGLTGFDFGCTIYKEQVEQEYKKSKGHLTIVFPDYVDAVSTTFVHGLFGTILKDVGISGFHDAVTVACANGAVVKQVNSRLY